MKATCVLCVNRDDGFLSQTIESVLNQTFKDFEFLIVANGPVQDLQRTISKFSDPRLSIVTSELECIGYARNLGIDRAKGEYILNIDSDDVCLPSRFEEQIQFMENNPDVVLASSWAEVINENNKRIGELRPDPTFNRKWLCVLSNPIINPSIIMRKSAWRKYKGYPGLQSSEDMAFWLKIIVSGQDNIKIIPRFHIKYRIHGNQTFRKRLPYVEAAAYQFRLFLLGHGLRYLLGTIVYSFKALLRGKN